jgi:large subunit ribosomal protein L17
MPRPKSFADGPIISSRLAKRGDLHARRMAMSIVREKDVVHKIFEEASERFGAINGGYTRIVKIGRRSGDAAAMTLVELVSSDVAAKPAKPKKSKVKATDKPVAAATQATGVEPAAAVSDSAKAVADDAPDEGVDVKTAPLETKLDGTVPDDDADKDSKASADPDGTDK